MFSTKFAGGAELARTLGKLSIAVSVKVSRDALKFAAEPVRAKAGALAPRRAPAPDLADNIVISSARVQDTEAAAVAIGPSKAFPHGLLQEIGTAHHAAQPFLRPAFLSGIATVLQRFGQEVWRVLASKGISRTGTSSGPTTGGPGGGLL